MQLGARWRVGETPHRSVPADLYALIAAREAAHPGAQAWTLTWLEGKPRLALDGVPLEDIPFDGVLIDEATGDEGDDDDWLS